MLESESQLLSKKEVLKVELDSLVEENLLKEEEYGQIRT